MESIAVENYRSIENSGVIEIKPLTVVLGKNSAGKSSFVRLFPLLKQTLECKTSEPLLWYGDYVDFGDYSKTISKYHKDECIKLCFNFHINPNPYVGHSIRNEKSTLVELKLSINETNINHIEITIYDQHIIMDIDGHNKVKVTINGNDEICSNKNILSARRLQDIIPVLYEGEFYSPINTIELQKYFINFVYNDASKFQKEYMFRAFRNMRMPGWQIQSKKNLLKKLKEENKDKFSSYKLSFKKFEKLNNILILINLNDLIEQINYSFFRELNNTSYLKPIRAMVNRYYRLQGISIDEVDVDGSNLPMILNNMSPQDLKNFEKWSEEKFGVIFSVLPGDGHVSLVVKDHVGDSKNITNVADTGYGYSQMLPIVMILWMLHKNGRKKFRGPDKTIVIEQPELHLHPAFQTKMVDVFVGVLKEAKSKGINLKIIFETHSEMMVNRIGEVISKKNIDPEDVNVLIFEKINDNTKIQSIGFNEDGLFTEWPSGFFSLD